MFKRIWMFLIVVVIITIAMIVPFSLNKEADYEFKGKYEYKIIDKALFNETYLSNSYGFLIGDLSIQGLEIKEFSDLDTNGEYIISLHHPIKAAYTWSKNITNEGQEHTSKKPLDIIQNKAINSTHIYIYQIFPKGKYRLLLP
jgi:hypothetical protein